MMISREPPGSDGSAASLPGIERQRLALSCPATKIATTPRLEKKGTSSRIIRPECFLAHWEIEEAQLRLISQLRGLYRKAFPASCHFI
jgi:hypothetical protein